MVEVKKEEKKNNNMLIVLLAILLTTLLVGGTTWYFMDQNEKNLQSSTDTTILVLQKKVISLEKNKNTTVTPTPTPTVTPTPTTTVNKDTVEELRTFCLGSDPDTTVGNLSYMESVNGIYGNCGMGSKSQPAGGSMLISIRNNGVWTKVWSGNGIIETATCDQYKIPSKMSGGTCNY